MRLLLDTNAYTGLMLNDSKARAFVKTSERLYLPLIVIGELLAGFAGGTRRQTNLKELEVFCAQSYVGLLTIDYEVSERYAGITDHLRQRGKPIPANDLWIASIAVRHNLTLLTFDRHFEQIPGLMVVPSER